MTEILSGYTSRFCGSAFRHFWQIKKEWAFYRVPFLTACGYPQTTLFFSVIYTEIKQKKCQKDAIFTYGFSLTLTILNSVRFWLQLKLSRPGPILSGHLRTCSAYPFPDRRLLHKNQFQIYPSTIYCAMSTASSHM